MPGDRCVCGHRKVEHWFGKYECRFTGCPCREFRTPADQVAAIVRAVTG